jgi:hypothetical protein
MDMFVHELVHEAIVRSPGVKKKCLLCLPKRCAAIEGLHRVSCLDTVCIALLVPRKRDGGRHPAKGGLLGGS